MSHASALSVIRNGCHLYRQSFLATLPFSTLFVVMLHLIRFTRPYVPTHLINLYTHASMIALVAAVPLIGAMILAIHNQAQSQPILTSKVFAAAYLKIVSFLGTIISMLLLPAIIIGLLIGVALGVAKAQPQLFKEVGVWVNQTIPPAVFMDVLEAIGFIFVLSLMTSRIFAPFLLYTDQLDSNTALDQSRTLVKGHYFRTLLLTLYNSVLLTLLWKLPVIFAMFAIPTWVGPILSSVTLWFILPWVMANMLSQQYALKGNTTIFA